MSLETILVKVSGDLTQNPEVLEEIKDLAGRNSTIVNVVYGFGTALSNELNERKIYRKKFLFEKPTMLRAYFRNH